MSALDAILDRESFALELAADALAEDDPNIDVDLTLGRLIELTTRLPTGLVHARELNLVSEAPEGLAPLAEGSAWYALDDRLLVVLEPKRSALKALISDLAMYFSIASRYGAALKKPALVEALANPDAPPQLAHELALVLGAPASLAMQIDRRAPGLRADLAAMAPQQFAPNVHIHAALRAPHLRVRGARIGRDLIARLPQGSLRLLISDSRAVLEHLSPYVRDLGFALSTWALENERKLTTRGLAEALRGPTDRASVDLAALVVPDLFGHAPELVAERREAEMTAGLYLTDDHDAVFGFADLSRLVAVDESAIAKEAQGTIAILVARAESLLVEAASELLDSGRVTAVSIVLGASIDAPGVIIPDALANDRDGAPIARAAELVDRAARLGVETHRPGCMVVDDDRGAPALAFDLIGRARRARSLGRMPDDVPLFPVLYPSKRGETAATLSARLRELDAGRVALSLLSSQEDPPHLARSKKGHSQGAPGISRRFRA